MGSFLYDTFFKSFSSKYCKEFTKYKKGKDLRKKRHQIFKLPNLCRNQLVSTKLLLSLFFPSVFGEKFPIAEFLNDVGRKLLARYFERK
jgi:hypothetical protein